MRRVWSPKDSSAVEGALARMPTILEALRQHVKELPEWFNKITSRVNAASASGGVGILESVLGGASAASGPTLQALVVRNLFRPFFTGMPNVGASVVFGVVAPDSLRLQPGIMALLSGGFLAGQVWAALHRRYRAHQPHLQWLGPCLRPRTQPGHLVRTGTTVAEAGCQLQGAMNSILLTDRNKELSVATPNETKGEGQGHPCSDH